AVSLAALPALIMAPPSIIHEAAVTELYVLSLRVALPILAGMSWSVAVAVKERLVSSSTALLPIAARTGATLTSATVTVIVSKSSRQAPTTATQSEYELGCWPSVGVKLKAPPAVIVAPVGT